MSMYEQAPSDPQAAERSVLEEFERAQQQYREACVTADQAKHQRDECAKRLSQLREKVAAILESALDDPTLESKAPIPHGGLGPIERRPR